MKTIQFKIHVPEFKTPKFKLPKRKKARVPHQIVHVSNMNNGDTFTRLKNLNTGEEIELKSKLGEYKDVIYIQS